MTYHTTDAFGITELNPPLMRMREVIASVREDAADVEHPNAWLTHGQSGWTLTYSAAGVMTLENSDSDEMPSRCIRRMTPVRALELWQLLASGDVRAVLGQPWNALV